MPTPTPRALYPETEYVLPAGSAPMIYSTTGPVPLQNGLTFSSTGLTFDPNQVAAGDLDCGTF